jgi:antitoxin (DNA-binding transcriptional repressor) of toxin-antitoxin stability system
MPKNVAEVTTREVRERLADLLRRAEQGASFVVRRRGKAVARLVPPQTDESPADLAEVRAGLREIRARVRGKVKVRALIAAGRRV